MGPEWPLLSNMERLKTSMKSGLGCPYHDLGADHAHGEMRFSAPWMQNNLVQNILPDLEGVVDRLQASHITFRASDMLAAALSERARNSGVSVSEYLRGVVREKVGLS